MALPNKLVAIFGPTASGKSAIALEIARYFDVPILSCDARQVFRRLSIGTAAPTEEDKAFVSHLGVHIAEPWEMFSAGTYYKQVAQWKDSELFDSSPFVLLVGGTMFYAQAILDGIADSPPVSPEIKAEVEMRFRHQNRAEIWNEIQSLDPEFAAAVDAQNERRLKRALEYILQNNAPFSSAKQHMLPALWPAKNQLHLGVERPREELYQRINKRVEEMWESGLVNEVESLKQWRDCGALDTVGYKETFRFLDKKISKEECIAEIQKNTRRYAKRQLTWLRKMNTIQWHQPEHISQWKNTIHTWLDA